MDPVSIFRALFDSECIEFGQHDLSSGSMTAAPYCINLHRLALHPKLQEAVVSQVVERYLKPQALGSIMAQVSQEQHQRKVSSDSGLGSSKPSPAGKHPEEANSSGTNQIESDVDSQLEDDIETCSDEEGSDDHPHPTASSFGPIISGVSRGAIPLAATIAYKARLPYLHEPEPTRTCGASPSDHDHDEELSLPLDQPPSNEHQQQRQQSIVLIEDVICSGERILKAVRSLERLGLKVEFVIGIVDREESDCNLLLERHGIKVFALYNMIAILRVLEATERISTELFIKTRQWITQNQFNNIGLTQTANHLPTATGRKTQSHADSTKALGPIEVVSS